MTKPGWFLFSGYEHSGYGQNSILNFFEKKKNNFFGFSCCSICEDLSIDVSITNVQLILTKLGCDFSSLAQVKIQGEIQFQTFLKKKIKFLGFHAVVLVKTFPLMYQLLM